MRTGLIGIALSAMAVLSSPAGAQATTRQCGIVEEPGPACLLARTEFPSLPASRLFWHIDRFSGKSVAERALTPSGAVVEAFGSTWLFTLAPRHWRARGGTRVSVVGPLPVTSAPAYAAEFLRSIFNPGTTAPLHTHSGPEAFFAVSGDTCLETPAGMKIGRGAGNKLVIRAGPPMLLMAIGKVPRQGFALILHDAGRSPTSLTQAWHPQGLCARQFAADKAR